MTLEVLTVKNAIKAAFAAETDAGEQFAGFNVYDSNDMPYRILYPYVIVQTPVTTLVRRYVGGARTFQLTARIEVYFTERDTLTISSVTYKREDLSLIYADRAEKLLDALTYSGIIESGIPTVHSMTMEGEDGRYKYYMASVLYMMMYLESD